MKRKSRRTSCFASLKTTRPSGLSNCPHCLHKRAPQSSIYRQALHYRRGHIPGAWFAIRGRLDRAVKKIHITGTLVLTSEDGLLADLATEEARSLTNAPIRLLKGGNPV